MKHLLALLLLAACAVSAQGQTIKTLGYNTTNGSVVYAGTNNLTFTSTVFFGSDTSINTSSGINYGGSEVINLEERTLVGDWVIGGALAFINATNVAATRTNLGLGATWLTNTDAEDFRTAIGLGETNQAVFREVYVDTMVATTSINNSGVFTNNGNITINQTATNNGLLFIYRTNNEAFLGLANLIASNNTTISNETLFRVGVSEATNKAAQFGFRSTNTNGNGVAVFSVFGYNALMMIGPSDPAAGTNPIQATIYSVAPTNKVMTLITTNTGAMLMHRPIGIDTAGVSTNAPANTTNVAGWIQFYVGTNSVRVPYYQ